MNEVEQTLAFMALANEVLRDSKPIPPEYAKVIDDNFWYLVSEVKDSTPPQTNAIAGNVERYESPGQRESLDNDVFEQLERHKREMAEAAQKMVEAEAERYRQEYVRSCQ